MKRKVGFAIQRIVISLAILILSASYVFSNDQQAVALANKAYVDGNYNAAVDAYLKIIGNKKESPELFYNLGNSYFKLNDFASAILWYERAKKLAPGDENIDFNLNVANTRIFDKIEPLPELFYKRWFYSVVLLFPADTWAWLSIFTLVAGLFGMAMFMVSRTLIIRKIGFWGGVVIVMVSLFSLIFAFSGSRFMNSSTHAIVFNPTITVKSSPDEKSTDLFVLHEGTKVQITDQISGWYEIRIANGSVGWLPGSALVKI